MNNEIINITFVGSARKNASKMNNIPIRAGVDGGRVLMAAGVAGGETLLIGGFGRCLDFF